MNSGEVNLRNNAAFGTDVHASQLPKAAFP